MNEATVKKNVEKLTAVYIECVKEPLRDISTNLEADAADPPPTIRGCQQRFAVYARQLSAVLSGAAYKRE